MKGDARKKGAENPVMVTVGIQMTAEEKRRIRENGKRNGRNVSAEIRHRMSEAYKSATT